MSDYTKFYGGHFVADYEEIISVLTHRLRKQFEADHSHVARLAVIVFAHPHRPLARDVLIPLVGYWNYRSGDAVEFFFPGFLGDSSDRDDEFADFVDASEFSDNAFVETIDRFEKESSWRYSGRTAVIICRCVLRKHASKEEYRAFLDFSRVIELELEQAISDGVIASPENLFEEIIRFAKAHPQDVGRLKLSDQLGAQSLSQALIDFVCENLPVRGLRRPIHALKHFREIDHRV